MTTVVFGCHGMLGRYVHAYFASRGGRVIGVDRGRYDASSPAAAEGLTRIFDEDCVGAGDLAINCIGVTKQRGDVAPIDFVRVNAIFPLVLAECCEHRGIHLVHTTTDCVFDGLEGGYDETHVHNAWDVYGKTKSLGEPAGATVIRTSIIGEEIGAARSLLEWVKANRNGRVPGFVNHIWNGVTCLQFAKVCEEIAARDLFWAGVRHVFSPSRVTKFELVRMIARIFELNIEVEATSTAMACDRSLASAFDTPLDIPMLEQQIVELKAFHPMLVAAAGAVRAERGLRFGAVDPCER